MSADGPKDKGQVSDDQGSLQSRKEKMKAARDERKRSKSPSGNEDAEYEVIDATQSNATSGASEQGVIHQYADQILELDLSRQSTYTQLAVGGACGWITGYVFGKVGKAVATALGGSLLLFHIGTRAGYISVDWEKVDSDMKGAGDVGRRLRQQQLDPATNRILDKGYKFVRKNIATAGGFAAGFFLGLTS